MKHQLTRATAHFALALAAIIASTSMAQAQEFAPDSDETISVNTRVARVAITVPKGSLEVKAPQLRWELTHNSQARTDLTIDAPGESNPLSLVVVIDVAEDSRDRGRYIRVTDQLEALAGRLHLKEAPRVVVASSPSMRFPFRWPKKWPTTYAGSTGEAFKTAIDLVEGTRGTRRALLVLTNRAESLPRGVFEDVDARLADSAAFIFLMAVRPPAHHKYGSPGRTIARTNLNTREVASITPDAEYAEVLFRYFAKLANAFHVVSYPLGEHETAPGLPLEAELKAISVDTGKVIVTQKRTLRVK
jgi:hypothetical protein